MPLVRFGPKVGSLGSGGVLPPGTKSPRPFWLGTGEGDSVPITERRIPSALKGEVVFS